MAVHHSSTARSTPFTIGGRDQMSGTNPPAPVTTKRVRHEVRDGLAVMAFSLTTSVAVAAVLMLLVGMQG
jgi:hypothetical protein